MSEAFNKIKTSHTYTGDADGLRGYYKQWAPKYDDDLFAQGWVAPQVTCDIVRAAATSFVSTDAIVLDAGCGTGLVGVGLAQRGFGIIDGIDLTEEMVRLAGKTGAYRNLRAGIDLNIQSMTIGSQRYDIVVSCGMFTHGHASPVALLSLIDYCLPGGLIVVSVRTSYMRAIGFEQFLKDKVLSSGVELLFCVPDAKYITEEGGYYWILRCKD